MILVPDKSEIDSDGYELQQRRSFCDTRPETLLPLSAPVDHNENSRREEDFTYKNWKRSGPRWRKKVVKRRCHSIILLLLVGYFIATFVRPRVLRLVHWFKDSRHIPVPSDISVGRCANFTAEPHPSFEFEMSLDAGYILARGGLASGQIILSQSTDFSRRRNGSRSARVVVDAIATDPHFYEYVQVCETMERGWKQMSGVGIFSVSWRPDVKGSFRVLVELPANEGAPLSAGLVRIDTPNFSQKIGRLKDVHFDRFEAFSSRAPIVADFISARSSLFKTTQGTIKGSMHATLDTELHTTKADIDVDFVLHDPQLVSDEKYRPASSALLRTTRGSIKAYSNLTSRTRTNGAFKIDASTTRGKVDIGFVEAPVNSSLNVYASTSFNEVSVGVHSTFEGKFRLGTLFPWQNVLRSTTGPVVQDPAGKGRPRVLHEYSRGIFSRDGAVIWGRGHETAGYVHLKSWLGSTKFIF